MSKKAKNIPHDFNNIPPIITPNDVISGFIFIWAIITVIIMCMMLFEKNNQTEVKDSNVKEESIQQLHPHIP